MRMIPLKRIVLVLSTIIGISFFFMISSASFSAPGNVASSDTTKAKKTPKKKRVPKKETSTTRTESTSHVESEDEEDFWGRCLGNCLDGLFDSIFEFGGDDDEGGETTNDYYGNEPEIVPPTSINKPGREIVLPGLPCSAIVAAQGTSEMAGALWNKPGGISTGAVLQTKLTTGTEITIVHQYKSMLSNNEEETWVKVEVRGGTAEGWMRMSDVALHGSGAKYEESTIAPKPVITQKQTPLTDSAKPKPTSTQWMQVPSADSTTTKSTNTQQQESHAAEKSLSELADDKESVIEKTPPTSSQTDKPIVSEKPSESSNLMESIQIGGYQDIADSRWQFLLDVSIPVFARSALSEEYHYEKGDSSNNLGYTIGGAIKFLPMRVLLIDASFGYTHIGGAPQFDYVIGNKIDSPQESDLSIFSLGLGAGQLYSFAGGKGFFTWSIGPSLYKVNESAKIDMYIDDDLVGHRTDEISVWKLGADVKIEVGGAPIDRFLLALYTRVSIVPWESKEEKSLTLDYLGHNNFTFFSFGLSIGTAFY